MWYDRMRKCKMPYTIQPAHEADYEETVNLTREAFWDVYKPGCDEHLLLHKLRRIPAHVPDLDLVIRENGKIVGSVVCSKAKVVNSEKRAFEVLCLGPISVIPSKQRNGIGSLLVKESIKRAKQLGYKGIFLWGNRQYYSRFGFRNAKEFNVQTATGENFDAFMGLPLSKGSLKGISGNFFEDEVFKIKCDELEEFEKDFPAKEKHVTDTQLK